MPDTEKPVASEPPKSEPTSGSEPPKSEPSSGSKPPNSELPSGSARIHEQWTSEYEKPSKPPLPIDAQTVNKWLETVLVERLLVIRGVDTDVLHAAEHAIVEAFLERFRLEAPACRRLVRRSAMTNARARQFSSNASDEATCTVDSLSKDWPDLPKGPMLVTAAAYNTALDEPLLASLPEDRAGLDSLCNRLGRNDRYLLILTRPLDFPLKNILQSEKRSFKGTADFIQPRLSGFENAQILKERLQVQYDAGLWAKSANDPALDDSFLQEFLVFLENGQLEWNIDELHKLSEINDRDAHEKAKEAYERQRQQKLDKSFARKGSWPPADQFFDQVLLFVAAFFDKLPIEDYNRIVSRLVGNNNRRIAVPVRTLKRSGRETIISEFQDVPLSHCWGDTRNSLVGQWGLKVLDLEGRYCVTALDAQDIRREFARTYPFTYMELWQRMLDGGFLFDQSNAVARAFQKLIVDRVSKDPDRFGQDFLLDVFWSREALGFEPTEVSSFEELFGRFKEEQRFRFVLESVRALLRAILDIDSRDVVAHSIEQLIVWRVPDIAAQLLRGLPGMPIAKRLKLVGRILHESEAKYWKDASAVLKSWLAPGADSVETIKWITESMTPPGSEPSGQSIEVADAVMDVMKSWFEGPGPDRHKLLEFLGTQPGEGLAMLTKWLFHPALERARNTEAEVAFFGLWLLAAHLRVGTREEVRKLMNLQTVLYMRFTDALSRLELSAAKPIGICHPPVVLEYQATVIAEWLAGLPDGEPQAGGACRKLLMEVLAKETPEDVRRQLFVAWRAMDEASAGKLIDTGDPKDAALWRKVAPTLQQGRKIFRQLMSDWVFPSKADAEAVSA